MQMIRWMCGVSMKDKKTSEQIKKLDGVEPITTVIRSGRLRCCCCLPRPGSVFKSVKVSVVEIAKRTN